jgi:hypothetical protein
VYITLVVGIRSIELVIARQLLNLGLSNNFLVVHINQRDAPSAAWSVRPCQNVDAFVQSLQRNQCLKNRILRAEYRHVSGRRGMGNMPINGLALPKEEDM